jgi:hypothetical protein
MAARARFVRNEERAEPGRPRKTATFYVLAFGDGQGC